MTYARPDRPRRRLRWRRRSSRTTGGCPALLDGRTACCGSGRSAAGPGRSTRRAASRPSSTRRCRMLWSADGHHRIAVDEKDGTSTIDAHATTDAVLATTTVKGLVSHLRWSPDGDRVVFTARPIGLRRRRPAEPLPLGPGRRRGPPMQLTDHRRRVRRRVAAARRRAGRRLSDARTSSTRSGSSWTRPLAACASAGTTATWASGRGSRCAAPARAHSAPARAACPAS